MGRRAWGDVDECCSWTARDGRSRFGRVRYGAIALLVVGVAAGCGSGGSAKASVASSTSRSTSTSTAAGLKSNCDLVTDQDVSTHFGVAVQGSVQPETKICEYQAADAATGGLTVSVSATRPRGRASFNRSTSAYTAVPATATNVNPGQVWSAPTLVSNLGGDDGFFAVDLAAP